MFLILVSFILLLQTPMQAAIRLPKFDLGGSDKQRIKLDLSGRWKTHLIGSGNKSPDSTRPLFELDDLPVSIFAAVDFDLSQRMGPIRWLATLLWLPRGAPWMSATAERDAQGNIAVQVEAPLDKPFSCQARYADDEPPQILLKVTPHARLQTEFQFIDATSLSIPSSDETNPNWWIPNVSVTALGRLNSHWNTCAYNRDNRHVQLRLTIRRNLGWSFMGRTVHDSPETWCAFQVEGTQHPMYTTTATLSGQLEDLSSWGLCLRQTIAASQLWPASLK